jgi:hypothetical protein
MSKYGNLVTTDPIINAETQQPMIYGIAIAFSVASFTAVGLRIYTRTRLLRHPGLDDVTIVIAEVTSPF